MSKASRDTRSGRFTVGRQSAEKFSAVEGQFRSARTGKLLEESDKRGESFDARRQRIRDAFKAK